MQDPARLLQHVLLCMPHKIWHAFDVPANFSITVLQSSGLNAFEVETLLLAAAVLQKCVKEMTLSLKDIGNLKQPPYNDTTEATEYPARQACRKLPKRQFSLSWQTL